MCTATMQGMYGTILCIEGRKTIIKVGRGKIAAFRKTQVLINTSIIVCTHCDSIHTGSGGIQVFETGC